MSDKFRKQVALRQSCVKEMEIINNLAISVKKDHKLQTKFKVRYTSLDFLNEEFQKYHSGILSLLSADKDSDLNAEDDLKRKFLEMFYDVKSIYAELFENDAMSPLNATVAADKTISEIAHVRLPQIDLKRFSGDIREFPAYKDMFDALVHSNSNLKPVEKFNYLISSLNGTPLDLIKHLKATNENYQSAYDTLIKRFTNPRAQARAYWLPIENFAPLKTENPFLLRKLLDTFSINLQSLKNMNVDIKCDFVLTHMLLSRLDPDTARAFENEYGSTEIPEYKTLFEFLERYCNGLNNISGSNTQKPISRSTKPLANKSSNNFLARRDSKAAQCSLCNENHNLYNCEQYLNKTPRDRFSYAKSKFLCFACLSEMHMLNKCKSKSSCRKCGSRKHHTTLHFENEHFEKSVPINSNRYRNETATPGADIAASSSIAFDNNNSFAAQQRSGTVMLGTALIEVRARDGTHKKFRALLDSGSEISIISQKSFNVLNLPKINSDVVINGIGNTQVANNGIAQLFLNPIGNSDICLTVDALILPKICDKIPAYPLDSKSWKYLLGLPLADPHYYIPNEIDVLLGSDIFANILSNDLIYGKDGGPNALRTIFGYVLLGKIEKSPVEIKCNSFISTLSENNLDDTMRMFFEIETVPGINLDMHNTCEDIFKNNVSRSPSGRYTVPLPFKELNPAFPQSRTIAIQRFLALERRLLRQPNLHEQYCSVIKEYLQLSQMEIVDPPQENTNFFYLPHHAVLRPDHATTKLRIVFNASAKMPNNKSLNDCLFIGNKLQNDISTILLKFRLHSVCFTADIKQMYRQILVDPSYTDYQRLIFRFSPNEKLLDLRIKTLCFGFNCAPYLAMRTIHQLVEDEGRNMPSASVALIEETYIDDVCSGGDSLENALKLKDNINDILNKGGFHLRKWSSNSSEFLSSIPADQISSGTHSLDLQDNCSIKILGLIWEPKNDSFQFNVETIDRSCTKRNILSELARIFDPLGFLAPITFLCKYLIQKMWLAKLDWDECPPDEILRVWTKYKNELTLLSNLRIPRFINIPQHCIAQLHGFCDASERGYSAVIYCRVTDSVETINTFFLCSKSKVAPCSKKLSIPRLELCGAVLLAKVLEWVTITYRDKICFDSIHAYTDSEIVLAWLNSSPHRWQVFVGNRVSFIQERVPASSWSHVRSTENPADLASRGMFPSEIITNEVWFQGPKHLRSIHQKFDIVNNFETQEELRKSVLLAFEEKHFIDDLLIKYSNFSVLQRILCYVLRFVFRSTEHIHKDHALSLWELNRATLTFIKRTQQLYFNEIFETKIFPKPFKKLNAFIDSQGIIRVGGRLTYSKLSFDKRHPVLLPQRCRLVELLIDSYHKKYLHAGSGTLHFLISQKYWILSARRAIRSVLSKCLKCWKTNPVTSQPIMGNLPNIRISPAKPFSHSGVDFCGPFLVTMSRHRGVKSSKAYVCVFVCMSTKAIHLELASDMSSDVFIAALRRFVARRGKCSHLYSDRGTNFVGANRELVALAKKCAECELITHHFLPGNAPHMGGLWEAGVRSVKTHLKRVIGDQVLSYEEFYTLLVQIEAVLNSRPLTPMSSDPNDLAVLTPGHFLTLEPLGSVPDENYQDINISHLKRWQLIQQMQQHFWRRWKNEYLHTLQQRNKWLKSSHMPKEGSLVLIKNDNLSPLKWDMGRILKLTPGLDGVARVADVKTKSGTIKRPLNKLCPLPVE